MTLAHTVLASLARSPGSGYDLSKHFNQGSSCYWKATQQQVYRELNKLKSNNWVEYEFLRQKGNPDKKVYKITDEGWAELTRWYAEPTEPTSIREDFLVKVLIGYQMPRQLLEEELQHRLKLHRDKLALYRDHEAKLLSAIDENVEMQFMYLTLRHGIADEMAWIIWCDEVMNALTHGVCQSQCSAPKIDTVGEFIESE